MMLRRLVLIGALAGLGVLGCKADPPPPATPDPTPDAALPVDAAPPAVVDAQVVDATTDAMVVTGNTTVIKLGPINTPKPSKPATKPKPPAAGQASIRGIINRNQNQVVNCYAAVAEKKPDIGGQLTVKWTLGADGTPTATAISKDTIGDPQVAGCVKAKASKWKFPPPSGGVGVVKYTWTLKMQ